MSKQALLEDLELKKQILGDLEKLGRQQLRGFEIIKQLHLSLTPFTVETGLATPTMKVIRPAARDRYQNEIKAMYRSLAAAAAK